MTKQEREILSFIAGRCHAGMLRPTTTDIYNMFSKREAQHALNMLQILGHIRPLPFRRPHGIRRYEITETGKDVLKKVAA